ncbi:hypothetical protein Bandiella_00720 [Candidatus Bandiella woodruffii]|uniref:Uncharacterized protein n=1 Tax=Candidatus Bandiella euplotis TaxID=1664265 RepID=A0ABZ0UND2_9RICK|nr:hypothetical protein Bandiella_00720 [Candidatus Bandiella woodruffii]
MHNQLIIFDFIIKYYSYDINHISQAKIIKSYYVTLNGEIIKEKIGLVIVIYIPLVN